jgi:phosphatidylserine/phosphatidylglycerophosphate/cardiolipin synthase-like enzyme
MYVRATRAGTTVVAYRGDAKTLLAFDLDQSATTDLAGFTIGYTVNGSQTFYLRNTLSFEHPANHAQVAGLPSTSSVNTPFHRFRWLHVPGAGIGREPAYGTYRYQVTPRYFTAGQLQPLDGSRTVELDIELAPFSKGAVTVSFTRGFVQSQAFVHDFGPGALFRPKDADLVFDTSAPTGLTTPDGHAYTWDDEYAWLGFSVRRTIHDLLDEVVNDAHLSLDVFAYDLDEPDVISALIRLAAESRLRLVLDDASLHHDASGQKPTDEDTAAQRISAAAVAPAEVRRGHFSRYSHDKVMIVYADDGAGGRTPQKVLTGSTNFSVTGLYVNSNHVLLFDDPDVASTYAQVFDLAWSTGVKAAPFRASTLSRQASVFGSATVPPTSITFAPHDKVTAATNLNEIAGRVHAELEASNGSVLFAVMALESPSSTDLLAALRDLHASSAVFTYGITDDTDGISLYAHTRNGVLVTGRPVRTALPAPFDQVHGLSFSHQVHHKFVVCDFNGPNPVVYCGSSNLALGGEEENGDNLLAIRDQDIATAFAIEAAALVDHFDFLDRFSASSGGTTGTPAPGPWFQSTSDAWTRPYFDDTDLKYTDRVLFAGPQPPGA